MITTASNQLPDCLYKSYTAQYWPQQGKHWFTDLSLDCFPESIRDSPMLVEGASYLLGVLPLVDNSRILFSLLLPCKIGMYSCWNWRSRWFHFDFVLGERSGFGVNKSAEEKKTWQKVSVGRRAVLDRTVNNDARWNMMYVLAIAWAITQLSCPWLLLQQPWKDFQIRIYINLC